MKITAIHPYTGPTDPDGLVPVYDITVRDWHTYRLAAGITVSNSKRISLLDLNALLSAGGLETLRDVGAVRGQSNPELWFQFMRGYTPQFARTPLVYEKFLNQLKAAGINTRRDGAKLHVMALSRHDVRQLTGDRLLKSGMTVEHGPDLEPVAGGLFDPRLTGGHGGKAWAGIALAEPMPSPAMEEPLRRILKLTGPQYEGVIAGTHTLSGFGTGPEAIARALDRLDLDHEIASARLEAEHASRSARDGAYRRLGYLKSARALGVHPRDWVLDRVPVLPPAFRPVSLMSSGTPLVADANFLYRDAFEANDNLARAKEAVGSDGAGPERLALYRAFKAVTGLGDPVTARSQEKQVQGVLRQIFGSTSKLGTVQRKLLSSTVDNVGRGVVAPNPDLDMDSLGIPEDQAFEIYGKFLVRRLVRRGLGVAAALRAVRDRTAVARDALQAEMAERPVFMNRAPVLHKFGIMAFRPRLVQGDAIQVPPLVVKGFGMDFDGDKVQVHVPSTDEAVREAYDRLLPSKSLLSPADFQTPVAMPGQEYLGGLYHVTAPRGPSAKPPRTFATLDDVKKAVARGELAPHDPVVVLRDG
jgi:DNA-directed RNA polymerase beta' subunit